MQANHSCSSVRHGFQWQSDVFGSCSKHKLQSTPEVPNMWWHLHPSSDPFGHQVKLKWRKIKHTKGQVKSNKVFYEWILQTLFLIYACYIIDGSSHFRKLWKQLYLHALHPVVPNKIITCTKYLFKQCHNDLYILSNVNPNSYRANQAEFSSSLVDSLCSLRSHNKHSEWVDFLWNRTRTNIN